MQASQFQPTQPANGTYRTTPQPPGSGQRLGQILIARGALSEDQLRIALHEQTRRDQPIGRLLVALGFVPEKRLCEALAENLGAPLADLANTVADPAALGLLPRAMAERHRLLPLAYDATQRCLQLAAAEPQNLAAIDCIRAILGPTGKIELRLAGEREIARGIDRLYGHELSIDGILHELESDAGGTHSGSDDDRRSVVRLVEALLVDAFKQGASDVHFEPEAHCLRIRYRIDGLLRPIRLLHKSCWNGMSVRLKVLAGMDVAESRAPQDGRFSLVISGHAVDFRVAAQPTLHGENFVLRILDRQKGIVSIEQLGLGNRQREMLEKMMARPEGIVLITGPTGSGKTTTLYSLLDHLNNESVNIMTLEDPVECPIPLLRQTSLSDGLKLDFAAGVRSILRQDPDIILIGEIRDAETASMAIRAAMTGHQVYTTLHANSAIGALDRLAEFDISPEALAGNVIGIIAQRLVRRLCEACRTPYVAPREEARLFGELAEKGEIHLFRPQGCAACAGQGYRGRQAIMEIVHFAPSIAELVARHASRHEIRCQARQYGYTSLAEDGLRQVLAGRTSLAELRRVADIASLENGTPS